MTPHALGNVDVTQRSMTIHFKVDGVYSSDPRTNKDAKKIETITHHDALSRRLNVFDSTALSLCMDNKLPISVFDIFESRNLIRICQGEKIGTLIDTK